MRRVILILSWLFALVPSEFARAQGGPPMLTDDPGTPGDGTLEVNVAVTGESTAADRLWELPVLDVNYGMGKRTQLNLETSLNTDAASGTSRWGTGATSLAAKWRFADQERTGVSMSIYPRIERALFESSVRRGLTERGTRILLPVEIARQTGSVGIDVEVGSQLSSTDRSRWIYGVVSGFTFNNATEAMAEIHGEALSRFEQDSLSVNVGLHQQLAARLSWIASAGHAVRTRLDGSTRWIAYCGLQWTH